MVAAGEVQGFPVVAAEGDIGGSRSAVDDAAELLALWVQDPDPAGPAAIDISFDIDLHAVGDAGLAAAQIGKDPVGVLGERAVGQQLESTDMTAPRVVDVEHRLIRREGQAVGQYKIVDQEAHTAEVGGDAVDAGKGQVPLLRRGWVRPRIGEIDAAVGLDDNVIGTVESAALKAVR